MTIAQPVRTLLGIATAWVSAYPLIFMCVWLVSFVGMSVPIMAAESGGEPSAAPLLFFPLFAVVALLHFGTILLLVGLEVFYLIHVIKNDKADDAARILLGVGNFFLPFVAMPVYYYAYIWRETPPAWAAKKS